MGLILPFHMGFYRAEWGIRSHLVAMVGAFLGAFMLPVVGFFVGYLFFHDYAEEEGIGIFLFIALPLTIIGVWLGQVAGCALALRLADYERASSTSLLLLLLAPVGFVLSFIVGYVIIAFFLPQGDTVSTWWLVPCLIPLLLMPILARTIALAKRPINGAIHDHDLSKVQMCQLECHKPMNADVPPIAEPNSTAPMRVTCLPVVLPRTTKTVLLALACVLSGFPLLVTSVALDTLIFAISPDSYREPLTLSFRDLSTIVNEGAIRLVVGFVGFILTRRAWRYWKYGH